MKKKSLRNDYKRQQHDRTNKITKDTMEETIMADLDKLKLKLQQMAI